jgi:hypothetical protein
VAKLCPVDSYNGTLPIGIPERCYTTSVYHRYYERNAWHSTWIGRYWHSDYSPDFDSLRSVWGQGSVWYIEVLPAIAMKYVDRTILFCRNHDGEKEIYKDMRKAARERPLDSLWRTFAQDSYFRLFICSEYSRGRFRPGRWRYRSRYETWSQEDDAQQFPEFLRFSRGFKAAMKSR